MQVLVSKKCGFCFGVENAIEMAEELLSERQEVYCLGSIIHNEQVVKQLAAKGLKVVKDLAEVPPARPGQPIPTVLIRSHGCHPDILKEIEKRGLQLVDATCILVKRAQKLVQEMDQQGYQVVIIGDPKHPEVEGAVGYAPKVTVVADEKDLEKLPASGRVAVISQTTQSPEDFGRLVGLIATHPFEELKVVNTICRETARRQQAAVELCQKVDVMFVLGGKNSANTRELAELCRRHNVPTYHLECLGDFNAQHIVGSKAAGVTAGASTPDWIIEEFVNHLQAL